MSHSFIHVEGLDETTKMAYRLLNLTNTPEGLLGLLPKFMESLEKDKRCKKAYSNVKARMMREDEDLRNHKQMMADWMKSKLKILKKLKCSKNPEVENAIDNADLILSGKAYEISTGGYLCVLTRYFGQACSSAAYYGDVPGCEEWLKVTVRERCLMFQEHGLENIEFGTLIMPFSRDGKKLIKRLGHGFIKAHVRASICFTDEVESPQYVIEWGEVDSIEYPDDLRIWRESQDLHRSQVQYDHKAEHNLRYLLHLCHFANFNPIPISDLPRPESVLDADALCNQQLLQYYLSGFRAVSWEQAPTTREAILSKLERLLTLLQTEDNAETINTRGPRAAKDDARRFVQETLEDEWKKLQGRGESPRNHSSLINAVLKAQANIPSYIQKAISDTLIKAEIRKFAKAKKWRAKRGKDRAKRHIA